MPEHQHHYLIEVLGHIGVPWSLWLGGLQRQAGTDDDGRSVTRLNGPVIDQAELRGILQSLWDLNLEILSVSRIAEFAVKNTLEENHI